MRVVIPSVGYADMLAVTLPAWRRVLPSYATVVVVTRSSDTATQAVCRDHEVMAVVTEAWRLDGASFNKAAALDIGFQFGHNRSGPKQGEWCLSIDADVFPGGPLPSLSGLRKGVLYGCARHLCLSPLELSSVQSGVTAPSDLPRRNSGDRGAGYFQLFKFVAGLTFGSFPTAGYYDLEFAKAFDRVVDLSPSFVVLHLGRTCSQNWRGARVTPRWGEAHG